VYLDIKLEKGLYVAKNKKLKLPNTSLATQSNELIEASYKMSVSAKRVMLMLLSHIHPCQQDISGKIRIEASDYAKKTGVSFKQSYSDIQNGCQELMGTIITTKDHVAKTTEACVVVHWMKYHENEGWLEATFTPWIAPFIHKLRGIGYKTLEINEALKFKRFYTIRLYELLMQWESSGIRLITLEDLRLSFNIEKKTYPAFKDFRVKVLEPSIKEIEQKTSWNVSYQSKKTGNKVTSFYFSFSKNKEEQKSERCPDTMEMFA
jgi:plasmid replication initiation protein